MDITTKKGRDKEIDFISRLNGFGSLTSAQTNNIRGINLNLNGTMAPKNLDSYGLTFFVRPDLNLTEENVAMSRKLTPLLSKNPSSMARAIRCMLDPRSVQDGLFDSTIFDNRQAFIPLLTNNLISISGFQDLMLDTYTSKEGNYKESWSMVDSTAHIHNTYDISASYRNIQGDPITLLHTVWGLYESLVYDGTLVPYPDNILQNRIDYTTRIYRLVLDSEWRYVQKIGATGASFPTVSPTGAAFNYSDDAEYNMENDQISLSYRCMGWDWLDPILIKEFNETVTTFNPSMLPVNREYSMVKISNFIEYGDYQGGIIVNNKFGRIGSLLTNLLSHQCYPWIEPQTSELEWWTDAKNYIKAIDNLKERGII